MEFILAPDIHSIVGKLIVERHRHLVNCQIVSVFCDKTPKSKGKEVWASMRKVSGLNAFLANLAIPTMAYSEKQAEESAEGNADLFVLSVSSEIWEILEQDQREALVDHELCHIDRNEEGEYFLVGHDIEEFAKNIKKYGIWRQDLQNFFHALGQQELFSGETSQ